MRFITLVARVHGTIRLVNPSFQFRVVTSDTDDNKFTDCAITADADYLITNDRDFLPLADAGYRPRPITPLQFIAEFLPQV